MNHPHYTTLISSADLAAHLEHPDWLVVDCRFSLADPSAGESAYRTSHIAGAEYAHLDRDLSAPVVSGVTGRHPLPDVESLELNLSDWGVDSGVQVVAYDDAGGAIAARLWWLLKWLDHDAVAVLDGGWSAWNTFGGAVSARLPARLPRRFVARPHAEMLWDAHQVNAARQDPNRLVVDSRTADRYRGENETLDPVAGHIPGANSRPFPRNLGKDGHFRPAEDLASTFAGMLGNRDAADVAFYCGSGVTAAHNVLAVEHAGLGTARLYAGSWSEWITDPDRPVALGPDP